MRVNAVRDCRPILISEENVSPRSPRALREGQCFKKEGGQVSGAERYAIGMFRFWRATCKMPLQTVLWHGVPNHRAHPGSLKLGELRKAP